jgi:C-terminal processing protease CtpA/Prc
LAGHEPQVYIESVVSGSEAEKAGVLADHVVVAINGHNVRFASKTAASLLLLSEEHGTGVATIVLTERRKHLPSRPVSLVSDEESRIVASPTGSAPLVSEVIYSDDDFPEIHRVVLQRPDAHLAGIGLALNPSEFEGSGPTVAFVANEKPKVLIGSIQQGDEIVAIEGRNIITMAIHDALDLFNATTTTFELMIRTGVVRGQQLSPTRGSPRSAALHRNRSWNAPPPSGCSLVSVIRDDGGLGFSICGGIDEPRKHGIFVADVNEHSPAGGKLFPGDLLLFVNHQILFDVTHDQAVDVLSSTKPRRELRIVVFRDTRRSNWRSVNSLKSQFAVVSFIEPEDGYMQVTGGANAKHRKIRVKSVQAESAAARVGRLRPGDHIIAVNQSLLLGLTHEAAILTLRASGSLLKMLVQRESAINVPAGNGVASSYLKVFKIEKLPIISFGFQAGSNRHRQQTIVSVKDVSKVPAAQARQHLQISDEIVMVNDTLLGELEQADALQILADVPEGDEVTFVTRRWGGYQAHTMPLIVARPQLGDDFGFAYGFFSNGADDIVLITSVDHDGYVRNTLKPGDQILAVNGVPTAKVPHAAVSSAIAGSAKAVLLIERYGPATPPVVPNGGYYEDGIPRRTSGHTTLGHDGELTRVLFTTHIGRAENTKKYGFNIAEAAHGEHYVSDVREDSHAYPWLFQGDVVRKIGHTLVAGMPHDDVMQLISHTNEMDLELVRTVVTEAVALIRPATAGGIGFRIVSSDLGDHIVSTVAPSSPSDGVLCEGDWVIQVDGHSVRGRSHDDVAGYIRDSAKISQSLALTIQRAARSEFLRVEPIEISSDEEVCDTDVDRILSAQKPMASPHAAVRLSKPQNSPMPSKLPIVELTPPIPPGAELVDVTLVRPDDGSGFGLSLVEVDGALAVNKLKPGTEAASLLQHGDILLEINEMDTAGMCRADAVKHVGESTMLTLYIRRDIEGNDRLPESLNSGSILINPGYVNDNRTPTPVDNQLHSTCADGEASGYIELAGNDDPDYQLHSTPPDGEASEYIELAGNDDPEYQLHSTRSDGEASGYVELGNNDDPETFEIGDLYATVNEFNTSADASRSCEDVHPNTRFGNINDSNGASVCGGGGRLTPTSGEEREWERPRIELQPSSLSTPRADDSTDSVQASNLRPTPTVSDEREWEETGNEQQLDFPTTPHADESFDAQSQWSPSTGRGPRWESVAMDSPTAQHDDDKIGSAMIPRGNSNSQLAHTDGDERKGAAAEMLKATLPPTLKSALPPPLPEGSRPALDLSAGPMTTTSSEYADDNNVTPAEVLPTTRLQKDGGLEAQVLLRSRASISDAISSVTLSRRHGTFGFSIQSAFDGYGVCVKTMAADGAALLARSRLCVGCKMVAVNGFNVEDFTQHQFGQELAKHPESAEVTFTFRSGNRTTLLVSDH